MPLHLPSEFYMHHVVKTKEAYNLHLNDLLLTKIIPDGHSRKHGKLVKDLNCIDPLSKAGSSLQRPLNKGFEFTFLQDFPVRPPGNKA